MKLRWTLSCLRIRLRLRHHKRIGFIVAGTQKAGTTALDAYLRDHPEICMAVKKEASFFDNEGIYGNGKPDYYKYHSLFKPERSHKILGEATPTYMYWIPTFERIWQYNPRMKIIISLRNPIDRAYSHWNMQRVRKKDTLCFWDALQAEKQRAIDAYPYQARAQAYMDRGLYTGQLKRCWKYFPRHQTLIITNDDLLINPKETLDKVCNFLGVCSFESVEPKNVYSIPYVSAMTSKERQYLRNFYDAEIRELGHLLGRDLSHWQ